MGISYTQNGVTICMEIKIHVKLKFCDVLNHFIVQLFASLICIFKITSNNDLLADLPMNLPKT